MMKVDQTASSTPIGLSCTVGPTTNHLFGSFRQKGWLDQRSELVQTAVCISDV